MIRSYFVYWWKLAITTLGNWGPAHHFVPPAFLGWFHAKLDLKHGITKSYTSGLKHLWHYDIEKVLWDDYRIEYINLNRTDYSQWHEAYENSYNRVSQSFIRQTHGVDVIELCLTKAEFRHREQARQAA